MIKLQENLGRILPLIKNIFVPAGLFCFGLLCFYACGNISPATQNFLHLAFYGISFVSFMILLYFNKTRPVFFILLITLSYIVVNCLKNFYGGNYTVSPYYLALCLLLPLNFALFYFIPDHRLMTRINVYLLLGIFALFSLGEFVGHSEIRLNLNLETGYFGNVSILGFTVFIITLTIFFFRIAQKGLILDYALFFAALNVFIALIYSDSATAITIFYSVAALTVLAAIVMDIRYNTYKDALTGLPGRYSYMINSGGFPLKYCIGLICIDDYAKLINIFGRRDRDTLVRMIAGRITEEEGEENVYRYNEDEFVIVFRNEDKNESFERLEKIRRSIASAEFVLNNRKKTVKLTVSTCVSEKKRSDANSIEVLFRAHKTLQKANEFSHNISSKA